MKIFLIVVLMVLFMAANAQRNLTDQINIYLVKKPVNCWDSVTQKIIPFVLTKEDLQDTPFIRNGEIVRYTITKVYGKMAGRKTVVYRFHKIQTAMSVNARIDSLRLSLFGCAWQFALVCDGKIVYSGCINNHLSSWVPPAVVLTGRDHQLNLDIYPYKAGNDPRDNKDLIRCLKKSGRLKYAREFEGN